VAKRKTKSGRITDKRVQDTEGEPFELPDVPAKAEDDSHEDMGVDGMNVRRRAFVEAITGPAFGNARRAASLAGYSDSNLNVLDATASRLLSNVKVQQAVRGRLAEAEMDAAGTRRAIAFYASSDMSAFVSVGADGEPVLDWVKAAAAGAIGNIREFREEGIQGEGKFTVIKRTFKLRDPMPALALMARMNGLVQDNPGANVNVNVYQANEDDLVRIATSSSAGSATAPAGAPVASRLRERD
jgi:phage terminase small subunit